MLLCTVFEGNANVCFMCRPTVFSSLDATKYQMERKYSTSNEQFWVGLLTVNRLTGYPVLKGWTGYKLNGLRNRSSLAPMVRLRQQVCKRHKVTSDDLVHTHTHYSLLRPTSVE